MPEAMLAVAEVAQTDFSILKGKSTLSVDDYSAIGVGPGIGTDKSTALWLESLFDLCKSPLVLDADALNIIAERPTLLKKIPAQSILTPHPGEFKRLVGAWKNDLEKIQKQLEFSANHDLVVVLKGANTSISTPNGKLYFNSTGNPGMAKGGSGDVLTGVLTSILAQGYTSEQSAILAVYVHGLAGDIACRHLGEIAMNAEDIIHYLPQAFKVLASSK
ncbi:MAG: NAD(P)H-hydrate dehydratase [Bacteroidetes bacterium]|nr:NAD(P)H-hydrate dehydratase [Bacteroidota bacterium]